MDLKVYHFAFIFIISVQLSAQNIGINATNPSEKLEVGGKIFSSQGGFKFPDSTLQTTAAYMNATKDAMEDRSFVLMSFETTSAGAVGGPYSDDTYDGLFLVHEVLFSIDRQDVSSPAVKSPFRVCKDIDQGSPYLLEAIDNNLSTQFNFEFLKNIGGSISSYLSLEIIGARLTHYSNHVTYKGNGSYAHQECFDLEFNQLVYTLTHPVIVETVINGNIIPN